MKQGLLIVDAQEILMQRVEQTHEITAKMVLALRGALILDLPVVVTEQYPKGLGSTISPIRQLLPDQTPRLEKMSFSSYADPKIKEHVTSFDVDQWVVCGIEAHVCILQTVRDMVSVGHKVAVLNDAISSRSLYDYSTAIGEMRDLGARISSAETLLFEWLKTADHPKFKQVSELVKQMAPQCCMQG